jgi:transcriptional regulator GlxA family with amidase domain
MISFEGKDVCRLHDVVCADTVRRAMVFCAERASEPVSAADIARAASTGVRSLQRAFRAHLEMTPLEYLRCVRLDRAHRDLVTIAEGRAEGTVAEVATRWGFMHLGRFSGQYRKTYGRTPVETLRATIRRPSLEQACC